MEAFSINFLDHVAIKVRHVETSVQWYEKVLGLRKYMLPEWGDRPVLMLVGKTGIAIFPAKEPDADPTSKVKSIRIDHFAFNVSSSDLDKAKKHFESIGQEYTFQDHVYFHSIYIKDPDDHTVELTAIVVHENDFYT